MQLLFSNFVFLFIDSKRKELGGLKQSDVNAYSVYGDWVVPLLNKIRQTNFRGVKPKGPIGMCTADLKFIFWFFCYLFVFTRCLHQVERSVVGSSDRI